jgi:hypothetical protein
MPPGMRFQTLFDLGPDRRQSSLPMTYQAKVSYDGLRGRRETEEYTLDMELFYGLPGLAEYGMHDVARSLQEISNVVKNWNKSGRLKVDATDGDYEAWSERWQFSRAGKYPSLAQRNPAGRPAPSKFDSLREPIWKRMYWPIHLRFVRFQELREDQRLEKAGRSDLVLARRQMREQI